MQIILGQDTGPGRSLYGQSLGLCLGACWRASGHQVLEAAAMGSRVPVDSENWPGLARELLASAPAARVHLIGAGPLSQALASECAANGRNFTLSCEEVNWLHDAAAEDAPGRAVLRGAAAVFTPTRATAGRLSAAGIAAAIWLPGGVDTLLFQPRVYAYLDLPRPITLLLGAELGSPALREFLETPLPGTRVIHAPAWTGEFEVGETRFVSHLPPVELPRLISAADVCVVGSSGNDAILTGLQSLACAVPVAARTGSPLADLLSDGRAGGVADGLEKATSLALQANRQVCRSLARRFEWQNYSRRILALGAGAASFPAYPELEVA